MNEAAGILGILVLFAWIFGFVLAVLWLFVPFAIFGIKPKLDALIAVQRQQAEMIHTLVQQTARRGDGG